MVLVIHLLFTNKFISFNQATAFSTRTSSVLSKRQINYLNDAQNALTTTTTTTNTTESIINSDHLPRTTAVVQVDNISHMIKLYSNRVSMPTQTYERKKTKRRG